MENRHFQMNFPKSARLFSLEFWYIVVGIKTWREVNEDDFAENRENLGPVQSSDGVATDVSRRDYADFAGGHFTEIVQRHLTNRRSLVLGLGLGFLLRALHFRLR